MWQSIICFIQHDDELLPLLLILLQESCPSSQTSVPFLTFTTVLRFSGFGYLGSSHLSLINSPHLLGDIIGCISWAAKCPQWAASVAYLMCSYFNIPLTNLWCGWFAKRPPHTCTCLVTSCERSQSQQGTSVHVLAWTLAQMRDSGVDNIQCRMRSPCPLND